MLHPLRNIKITKYCNYGPRFNRVFSRNYLSKIKDELYLIYLNDKKVKELIGYFFFIARNTAVYFESSGIFFYMYVIGIHSMQG